jgi:hypothetical protein
LDTKILLLLKVVFTIGYLLIPNICYYRLDVKAIKLRIGFAGETLFFIITLVVLSILNIAPKK